MKGIVDEQLRALLTIALAATREGVRKELAVWVDTAFNGGLVLPRSKIEELGLIRESSGEAILADGSVVELELFSCFVDWFGNCYQTQVIANDGAFPLLGTQLLDGRRLAIDYITKTLELV